MEERFPFPRRGFATTRWSIVLTATQGSSSESRSALETLLSTYWYPLYAFARRRGIGAEEAADLTQGFFARLLEKRDISGADREKGKFRHFLLGAFQHYLANERDKAQAKKRGGGREILSLDFDVAERRFSRPSEEAYSSEKSFEREWAVALLDQALREVEAKWHGRGKGDLYRRLIPFLTPGKNGEEYLKIAGQAEMSEGAFKVAAHRLRQDFRKALKEKLAETVSGPDGLEEEIRELFRAFES